METEIVTVAPIVEKPHVKPTQTGGTTTTKPVPQPVQKPTPKVRKMKQQIPSGKLTVGEYRKWLQQQLAMLNGFESNDSLDFDN